MKRIYVDMDDVLCDFMSDFRKNVGNYDYPQSRVGFFLDLVPLPDALETYKELEQHYDMWILTRPSFYNIHCYTEKAQWIRKHLGFETQKKLILCPNKSLVIGDYLIDDGILDCQKLFNGEFLRFGSEDFPNWLAIKKYLL